MGNHIVSLLTGSGGGGGSLPPKVVLIPADFPTVAEANNNMGRIYIAAATVTDSDPTKTNTGQSFISGEEFVWNGVSAYFKLGADALWLDTGVDLKTVNPRNIDLQSGGLKDTNVITPVKLGSVTDIALNTTKKDLIGGTNEVKLNSDNHAATANPHTGSAASGANADITSLAGISGATINEWVQTLTLAATHSQGATAKAIMDAIVAAGGSLKPENLPVTDGKVSFTITTGTPVDPTQSLLFLHGLKQTYGAMPNGDYTIAGNILTWNNRHHTMVQATDDGEFMVCYNVPGTSPGVLPQKQIYYVADAGSDLNTGKSIEQPFLTLGAAITAVTGQTPSSTNRFLIQVVGNPIHPETITIPDYTTLISSGKIIGDINLGIESKIKCREVEGRIRKNTANEAYIDADYISNSDVAIRHDAGNLFVNVNEISHSGTNPGVIKTVGAGNSYLNIRNIESSATADTVTLAGGFSFNNIGLIQKTNASGSAFKCSTNHSANGLIQEIIASSANALEFSGISIINLRVGNYTGAISDDGTNTIRLNVSNNPVFAAYNPSIIPNVTGDTTLADIIFSNEDADVGSNYNSTTGVFTAPFTGLYQFDITLFCDGLGAGHTNGYIKLNVTGAAVQDWFLRATNPTNDKDGVSGDWINSCSVVVKLTKGDAAKFQLYVANGAKSVNISSGSRFSGRLIQTL